jgi:biopolymer transport protein ExbD
MPIQVPGKRYGKRLQHSKVFGHGTHGKKSIFADLLITPLVDMFVIIVLFLIANFSATGEVLMMSKDIQLPSASHVKDLDLVPVVMVSKDEVIVEGSLVGKVAEIVKSDQMDIPELEERLREMKKKTDELHALAQDTTQQSTAGDVNIQADKDVTFKIIQRVMFSCASADYQNINFAVLSTGTDEGGATGTKTASATP